jgi:hypothetical protein
MDESMNRPEAGDWSPPASNLDEATMMPTRTLIGLLFAGFK